MSTYDTNKKSRGYFQVPNTLIDHSALTAHELLVYLVLLRHRNSATGKCFPGLSLIADESRISRKSVIRAIEGLERTHGLIKVTRHPNVGPDNRPNIYDVGLYNEEQGAHWATSVKGKRTPRRQLSDESRRRLADAGRARGRSSEALPQEREGSSSASQAPRSASQAPEVVPPRRTNKTNQNNNQEQILRSGFPPDTVHFSTSEDRASEKQLSLLSDLWIHATANTPPQQMREKWSSMTLTEARELIPQYYAAIKGRIGKYDGPEHGTPAYMALSPTGKKWADTGMDPETARQLEGAAA